MIYQSNSSPTGGSRPEPNQSAAESAATNDNPATSNQQANVQPPAGAQTSAAQLLRQQRPIRPNLRRQVVVAARDIHHQASVPLGAHHIELATVLPARAKLIPPQRPAHLPARYDAGFGRAPAGTPPGQAAAGDKPNRYAAWAQQQQRCYQWGAAAEGGGQHGFQHHFASPLSSAASRVLVVNPMQIVNLSEHTKSRLIKVIEAVKRFSEKWFSHVLLLMFLAVYACFGAYIFISFEAPTEQWEKQLIIDTRHRIVNESWQEARDKSREQFLELYRGKFEEYERLLNRVCASGMTSSSLENQWTFWGALFYSMTVFTTIGYGHLTPITFAGRVATMVYAIFGIPILLMVLADLGKLLTRIIKFTFKRFRSLYNKLLGRKASIRTRKLISDNTSQYIGVARDAFERGFAYIQPYNKIPMAFRNASFRSAASKAKSGESSADAEQQAGDLPQPHKRDSVATDVIVTPVKQTKPVSPPIGNEEKPRWAGEQHAHNQHQRSQSPSKPKQQRKKQQKQQAVEAAKHSLSQSSSASNVDKQQQQQQTSGADAKTVAELDASEAKIELETGGAAQLDASEKGGTLPIEFEHHEDEDLDEEDFDIPVSFALFLLVTYMMFGAVVFSIWEGWNFFDALYFVFISMSTIGFGDLVPQHPKRMIGTFIYLLLGLALTSMCINVVQEKIHATFLRAKLQIGEKMGLDLDQIMADDYYDGPLGIDSVGGGDEDDANSLAVSQTNSSGAQAGGAEGCDQEQPGDGGHHPEPGVKQSRSRESLKAKRRSGAGLAEGAAGGVGAASGSLKRKSSRKISRNQPQQQSTISDHDIQQRQAPVQQNVPPQPPVAKEPVRAEFEVCRAQQQSAIAYDVAPSLNFPVNNVSGFCEPLDVLRANLLRSPLGQQRPRLSTARSQPTAMTKSLSSESNRADLHPIGSQGSGEIGDRSANGQRSSSSIGRPNKSEGSTRRASVSNELNQLDDLIKVLSRTPSERFGPLLGVPSSSRSSRSNSPSSSLASRRGTSMTIRRGDGSPRPPVEKKRSLVVAPAHLLSAKRGERSNSSESQSALEELKAIKHSAV